MLYQFANNGKLSGRASGNVYARNGRVRGMTVPKLVQNSNTQRVRSMFGTNSSSFRNLSADQIREWNGASGFATVDRFGNEVNLTGKTLFVSLNQNLKLVGAAPITSPPTPVGVIGLTSLTIAPDKGAGTFDVDFLATPVPADSAMLISATAPVSKTITRPGRSAFRDVATKPAATATGFDLWADYTARFGVPAAGTRIFVRAIIVSTITGQASASIVTDAIVV